MKAQYRNLNLATETATTNIFLNTPSVIATTDKNGTVRLYHPLEEESTEPLKPSVTLSNHVGLITDVSFAPSTHQPFLLTTGYDRTINLSQNEKLLFTHKETKQEVGFYTNSCFLKTNPSSLVFLVGSSNGYVLEFNSDNKFKPTERKQLEGKVISLEAVGGEFYVICSEGEGPKICSLNDHLGNTEIKSDLVKEKIKFVRSGEVVDGVVRLLIVSETNKTEIWRVVLDSGEMTMEGEFEMAGKVLGGGWRLSGLSVDIVVQRESEGPFGVTRLSYNIEDKSGWGMHDIETLKEENINLNI